MEPTYVCSKESELFALMGRSVYHCGYLAKISSSSHFQHRVWPSSQPHACPETLHREISSSLCSFGANCSKSVLEGHNALASIVLLKRKISKPSSNSILGSFPQRFYLSVNSKPSPLYPRISPPDELSKLYLQVPKLRWYALVSAQTTSRGSTVKDRASSGRGDDLHEAAISGGHAVAKQCQIAHYHEGQCDSESDEVGQDEAQRVREGVHVDEVDDRGVDLGGPVIVSHHRGHGDVYQLVI